MFKLKKYETCKYPTSDVDTLLSMGGFCLRCLLAWNFYFVDVKKFLKKEGRQHPRIKAPTDDVRVLTNVGTNVKANIWIFVIIHKLKVFRRRSRVGGGWPCVKNSELQQTLNKMDSDEIEVVVSAASLLLLTTTTLFVKKTWKNKKKRRWWVNSLKISRGR